ncbi:hypothetical protein LOC67_05860 [Stieleria sp. JC731]|nr:hypothetical protein [Stieleria sp. JC731]MCC9600079.1 hypothetical protein [Stieleria sp. JC731]
MSLIPMRQSASEEYPLLGGRQFSRAQLDELDIAFSAAGLNGYHRRDGRIWVAPERRQEFLAVAKQANALPVDLTEPESESPTGFELFLSESQRKSQQQSQKTRELGTKLCAFPDIAWASVDYDQKVLGGLNQETIQSASVVIIPSNEKPLSPNRIDMIRQCVAGAFAGMTVEQVTVTDTTASESYNGRIDEEKRAQRHIEYEMEQRLADLLVGFGNVRVAVMHSPVTSESGQQSMRPHVSIAVSESQFHRQWARDYRALNHNVDSIPWPSDAQLATSRDRVIANVTEVLRPLVGDANDSPLIHVCGYPDSIPASQYGSASDKEISLEDAKEFAANNIPLTVSVALLLAVTLFCSAAALRMRTRETDPTSAGFSQSLKSGNPTKKTADNSRKAEDGSIRDDLTELIEANPELAAQIVHRWMAEAA